MALVTNDNVLRLNAVALAVIGLGKLVDPSKDHNDSYEAVVPKSETVNRWFGLLACLLGAQMASPTFGGDNKSKQLALKTAAASWAIISSRHLMLVTSKFEKPVSWAKATVTFALAGLSLWQALRHNTASVSVTTGKDVKGPLLVQAKK